MIFEDDLDINIDLLLKQAIHSDLTTDEGIGRAIQAIRYYMDYCRSNNNELIDRLRKRVAKEFGRINGWVLSDRMFLIGNLSFLGKYKEPLFKYIDHTYFYRSYNNKPIAFAVHLYDWSDDIYKWANDHSLVANFPEFPSWHYPGYTTLVVYTLYDRK